MDKEAYFDHLNYKSSYGHQLYYSNDIAQQKKAATTTLNGLRKLHEQVAEYIDDEEDNALQLVIKLTEKIQQVRQVAASSAKREERKAEAKREMEVKQKKGEINECLFADRSDDESIMVIEAFAEFLHIYPMRYIKAERFIKLVESSHIEVKELKSRIVDELFEHQEHWDYAERFNFDRFEAFCDQKLAESAIEPVMANRSDDAAQEFSL